ncbi:MAG TPA: DUF222 domain-containing protein, partial [Acidimicrobiia bacterium]|nr:DUF222 domain-containing protein [Acidimicrobiia bacterium]
GVARDYLSDYDRVEVLKARARQVAHDQAGLLGDMVGILESEIRIAGDVFEFGDVHDLAAAEIGIALSWTRRASERQLDFASTLLSEYPAVWDLLETGQIDLPRARVIVETTLHLEPEVRGQVVEQVLGKASGQTTGQLAARIRRLAITVDPDQAKKGYEQGVEERRLGLDANPDGTANLCGYQVPADRSQTAMRRINRAAHQLKATGDPRSLDQIRADLFLDLLNGQPLPQGEGKASGQGRNRGVVDIHVELSTLLGLDDQPGEIPGWGPVIADVARQVIEEQFGTEWRYTITDPNGNLISNGTTRKRPDKRRPTAAQKRQVQAETPECVWPTCRFDSIQCDIDHNLPWADHGPTIEENLAPLCRHHHVIRHNGWTITQIQPGVYTITSPLGHTYTTQPRAP